MHLIIYDIDHSVYVLWLNEHMLCTGSVHVITRILSRYRPLCYFTGGDDYVIADSVLVFNKGQTELSFDVNITDDVCVEPHEVFTLELARPRQASSVCVARITPNIARVILADDDG